MRKVIPEPIRNRANIGVSVCSVPRDTGVARRAPTSADERHVHEDWPEWSEGHHEGSGDFDDQDSVGAHVVAGAANSRRLQPKARGD